MSWLPRSLAPNASSRRTLLAAAVCLLLAACQPDVVMPGFYGYPDAGPAQTISQAQNGISGLGSAGRDGFATAGFGASAGAGAGPVDIGQAGTSAGVSGDGAAADGGTPVCDMRGRWLVTQHVVVDGLGQLQTSHTWKYYEIDQQGEALTVTKGLHCGDEVVTRTALGANGDMHTSWPGSLANVSYAGQRGTSRMTSAGCEVSFEKRYVVLGATVSFYSDPTNNLPTIDQQANGSTPGWEDWEGDGEPGITVVLSGAVTGRRFMASRTWHELSGTFPSTQGLLKLADNWNEEDVALKIDGSPLLNSMGVRAADTTLHFVEMARLDDTQATGDDTAICAAIRMLAKTLTPNAAMN